MSASRKTRSMGSTSSFGIVKAYSASRLSGRTMAPLESLSRSTRSGYPAASRQCRAPAVCSSWSTYSPAAQYFHLFLHAALSPLKNGLGQRLLNLHELALTAYRHDQGDLPSLRPIPTPQDRCPGAPNCSAESMRSECAAGSALCTLAVSGYTHSTCLFRCPPSCAVKRNALRNARRTSRSCACAHGWNAAPHGDGMVPIGCPRSQHGKPSPTGSASLKWA